MRVSASRIARNRLSIALNDGDEASSAMLTLFCALIQAIERGASTDSSHRYGSSGDAANAEGSGTSRSASGRRRRCFIESSGRVGRALPEPGASAAEFVTWTVVESAGAYSLGRLYAGVFFERTSPPPPCGLAVQSPSDGRRDRGFGRVANRVHRPRARPAWRPQRWHVYRRRPDPLPQGAFALSNRPATPD